jgi:hypothetical protein
MSSETLQAIFLEPSFELQADMAGKSAEETVFAQMKVPPWGRLLIKLLIVAFLLIGGALWKLTHDVGVVEGQLKNLPQTLSAQLVKEAENSANAGKIKEASRSVEMAATLIKAARQNKVGAKAEYFKSVSDRLKSIQSSPLTDQSGHPVAGAEELIDGIDQVWLELADYRSSLQPVPPIPRDAKTVTSSISGTSFYFTGSTILYTGPAGPVVISVPTPTSQVGHFTGITFVALNPGAYQVLNGVVWTNVAFVNIKIKDDGTDPFELHNVIFINCTFEITNDVKNGHLLVEYAALNLETLSRPPS